MRYKMIYDKDANREIDLESVSEAAATVEALEILGWSIVRQDEGQEIE